MILVTGASGHLGKSVIEFLLRNKGIPAAEIAALVRDTNKAADLKAAGVVVRPGDYDDYASLVEGFEGVDKLLFISGTDLAGRLKQHENVVKAAREAGVRHILYTSVERKSETESSPIYGLVASHIGTEGFIRDSGLKYTIFRNNLYMDVLPWFLGQSVVETGIFFPAGETTAAFTLRLDMAEAIANVLSGAGHENSVYHLNNPVNASMLDVAKFIGEIVGKDIDYVNPPSVVFLDTLTKAGVPMEYARLSLGFAEAIKQGEFQWDKTDLEFLLGRKATGLREFLAGVYAVKG